jgi:hypothetical protein
MVHQHTRHEGCFGRNCSNIVRTLSVLEATVSEAILKFNNVTNDVVDGALEINCIVDFVQTDCQFVLKTIENMFDGPNLVW